ncbi:MAG: DUF2764 family protein [Gemmatimonadetes bacterium]|nr:DUF2764 family protein [Gemmatimonadota bacterium]
MFGDRQYYTFLASVPRLPRFDRAERLPIHRERLQRRLGLLAEPDRRAVEQVARLLTWRRPPSSDAKALEAGRAVLDASPSAEVRDLVRFRLSLRVVVAALRARQQERVPAVRALLAGSPVELALRWDEPDLGLARGLRWVTAAREHIATGRARALDSLLLGVAWDDLTRRESGRPFSLLACLAYVLKWDVLDRWFTYDDAQARQRFETLALEALSEHAQRSG